MHRRQKSTLVRIGRSKWINIDPLPVIKQETPKYAVFISETLETRILTEREIAELLAGFKVKVKVGRSRASDQRETR